MIQHLYIVLQEKYITEVTFFTIYVPYFVFFFTSSVYPKRAVCFARNVIHSCQISANFVGKLNVLCWVQTVLKNLHQVSLLKFSALLEIVGLTEEKTDY